MTSLEDCTFAAAVPVYGATANPSDKIEVCINSDAHAIDVRLICPDEVCAKAIANAINAALDDYCNRDAARTQAVLRNAELMA